jgi:hypothetical protein
MRTSALASKLELPRAALRARGCGGGNRRMPRFVPRGTRGRLISPPRERRTGYCFHPGRSHITRACPRSGPPGRCGCGHFRDEFRVQRVHIVAQDIDHAACDAVAGMPGKIEQRALARYSQLAGIALRVACRDLKLEPKAKLRAVERLGRIGVGDVQHWDGSLEQGFASPVCDGLAGQRAKTLVFRKSLRNLPLGSYFAASWTKSPSFSYLDRSSAGLSVKSLPQ